METQFRSFLRENEDFDAEKALNQLLAHGLLYDFFLVWFLSFLVFVIKLRLINIVFTLGCQGS